MGEFQIGLQENHADEFVTFYNGGYVSLYTSNGTLVAELGTASFSVTTFNAGGNDIGTTEVGIDNIPLVTSAISSGTIAKASILDNTKSDGITGLAVGIGSTTFVIDKASVTAGENISLKAFTYTLPTTAS